MMLTSSVDREARHYKALLRERLGIRVVSVTQPMGDDPRDPSSFLAESIREMFDEYYSVSLSFWTRAGLAEKARQGHLVGATRRARSAAGTSRSCPRSCSTGCRRPPLACPRRQGGRPSEEYLLRKLLYCERCGARMQGTRGSRTQCRRYRCGPRRHGGDCTQTIVQAEPLEARDRRGSGPGGLPPGGEERANPVRAVLRRGLPGTLVGRS